MHLLGKVIVSMWTRCPSKQSLHCSVKEDICAFIFLRYIPQHGVQRLESLSCFGDVMGDITVSGAVIRDSTAKILESVYYINGGTVLGCADRLA